MNAPVTALIGGRPKKLTAQRAMILRTQEKALKGDARSLQTMLNYAQQYSVEPTADTENVNDTDQAILDDYVREILARETASRLNDATLPDAAEKPV